MGDVSTAARVTCAAIVALLMLSGCGDDSDGAPDNRTSVSWLDTDVCALVDTSDVEALIGHDATSKPEQANPRRPECVWVVPGTTRKLVLRLWQPPVPQSLSDTATRTTSVGGRTGYVETENKDSCMMHVEAEPAWLSVDLAVPHDGFRPRLCDAVVPTAEQVLAFVK
jgi:hypothetical protein